MSNVQESPMVDTSDLEVSFPLLKGIDRRLTRSGSNLPLKDTRQRSFSFLRIELTENRRIPSIFQRQYRFMCNDD